MATTAQGGPKSTGVRMIFGMENANYKGRGTASAGAIGNAASAGSIYNSLTTATPQQSTDNEPLFVLEDLDWEDATKSWTRGELGGTKIAVLQTEEDTQRKKTPSSWDMTQTATAEPPRHSQCGQARSA